MGIQAGDIIGKSNPITALGIHTERRSHGNFVDVTVKLKSSSGANKVINCVQGESEKCLAEEGEP